MTSYFDLKRPFKGSHVQICTNLHVQVINSSLNEHGSERFEQI